MPGQTISWNRVYAITFLNSAIVICWMAYHFFQPKLLSEFGLTEAANTLDFSKNIVLVIVPIIAGYLADLMAQRFGKKYIIFTVGISATAFIFFASAYVFLDAAPAILKSYIPFFMVLWLIAMNIFYAPSTGFLLNSSTKAEFPLVIAFITVATNLLFAVLPYLMILLELIGSSLTFVTGASLLIASSWVYFRVTRNTEGMPPPKLEGPANFLLSVWAGVGTGLLKVLALAGFAAAAKPFFGSFDILTIVFVLAAILAFPLCYQLMKYPLAASYHLSLGLSLLAISLLGLFPSMGMAIVSAILLAVGSSAVAVASFPYALSKIPPKHANLGVGLFLGAFSLPMSVAAFL